jgi:hypothetical protein
MWQPGAATSPSFNNSIRLGAAALHVEITKPGMPAAEELSAGERVATP